MSPCPDETALLDFVAGAAAAEASEAVHAHLASCPSCERVVAELARETPDGEGGPAADQRPLRRGEAIGRYIVLEELGAGGMGVVYAAFDPQLDRKVALKLLRPDAGGASAAEQRARLLGEAQALARLSHPNVVTVYEAEALGERVWLAMELIEGETLTQWRRSGQRSARAVIDAFAHAGQGLQAAHQAGLVHRDFKPDNVLIGADGRVRVTDFGLARKPGAAASLGRQPGPGLVTLPLSTVTGALMGTPAYMAPEQWDGQPADARSDQFSFCVALWEALAGVRPFRAERVQELPAVIKRQHPDGGPHPQRIPSRARRVLVRGLKVNPAERHASMAALLAELARDPLTPFRKPLAVAAALVLLAVGVALGLHRREELVCSGAEAKLAGAWDAQRKDEVKSALGDHSDAWRGVERALDAYALNWVRMHREACLATRVRREQSEQLLDLRVACLERRARDLQALTSLFVRRGHDISGEAAQASYALPPLKECAETDALAAQEKAPKDDAQRAKIASVQAELSEVRALISAGNYAAAAAPAEAVVQQARQVAHAPTRAEALYQLGLLRSRSGDAPGAEQVLLETAWEAEAGRHDRLAARARIDLVTVVGELAGRMADAAGRTLPEARAALLRFGRDADLESGLESAHAGVLTAQDKCEEALAHLRLSLQLADQAYEADDPRRALILNNLGNAFRCVGDYDGALAQFQAALVLREHTFGKNHPEVAVSLNSLGNVYFYKQDFERALPYYERVLAIRQAALRPDSTMVAGGMLNVGVGLIALHRNAEGREYAAKALALYQAALGKDSPRLILPLSVLGHVEVDLGQPGDARRHLERALQLLGTREDDATALARFNLARALRGEHGDEGQARELAQEARRYYQRRKDARKRELEEIDDWLKGPRAM